MNTWTAVLRLDPQHWGTDGTGHLPRARENTVRITVQRLITGHRRTRDAERYWPEAAIIDLAGALLQNFDGSHANFDHADFSRTDFFGETSLVGASFVGARTKGAKWRVQMRWVDGSVHESTQLPAYPLPPFDASGDDLEVLRRNAPSVGGTGIPDPAQG